MREFEGKVVLITGGNKGIGKGIALEFAKRGAKLVIGCNQNPEMAKDTLDELNNLSEAVAVQADISSPENCKRLVSETVSKYGSMDILINNAALQTHFSALEGNYENYIKLINTNLRPAFILAKYSHEYLKKSGEGRIILISSVHGKRPIDYDASYSISKGGLKMFMREAAVEFAPDKITVNIIAPAAVTIESKTGNPRAIDSTFKRMENVSRINRYQLGRMGLPSDTANMACYLASKEAEHITGTTIRLDGGAMLL